MKKINKSGSKNPRVSITLDQSILDAAAQLAPVMRGDLSYAAYGRISNTAVLRIAIIEGLSKLQRRHAALLESDLENYDDGWRPGL